MSVSPQAENALFAERIKQERLKHGLTQQELGDLCKLGANQISRYELGERVPSFEALARIVSVLNVSADYFLGIIDEPSGRLQSTGLSPYDRELIEMFHREGWSGVIKLGAERIGK